MTTKTKQPESMARQLAAFAALPLPTCREAAVASILFAWLGDANELSRKMSAAAHQDLVPATMFTHPAIADDESA